MFVVISKRIFSSRSLLPIVIKINEVQVMSFFPDLLMHLIFGQNDRIWRIHEDRAVMKGYTYCNSSDEIHKPNLILFPFIFRLLTAMTHLIQVRKTLLY
jgi:hypothetical protein